MTRLFFLLIAFSALMNTKASAEVSDEQILKAVLDFHLNITRKVEGWDCSYQGEDLEGTPVARLKGNDDNQVFIVPVLCFAHQSNATTVFYKVTDGDRQSVSPLSFPVSPDGKEFMASVPLANGDFSAENDEVIEAHISGYGYMRDLCGSDLRYVWNGYAFALSEVRYRPCCGEKGAGKWCDRDSDADFADDIPVVFSHKVERQE